jgi:hypothetical protein
VADESEQDKVRAAAADAARKATAGIRVNPEAAARAQAAVDQAVGGWRLDPKNQAIMREALRRMGVRLNPLGDLAQTLVERSQEQDEEGSRIRTQLSETSARLDREQAEAQKEGNRAEVDRIEREQRAVAIAELTHGSVDAIRHAVEDGLIAAAASQRRMERITWGLLLFAALTLVATIIAVANIHS